MCFSRKFEFILSTIILTITLAITNVYATSIVWPDNVVEHLNVGDIIDWDPNPDDIVIGIIVSDTRQSNPCGSDGCGTLYYDYFGKEGKTPDPQEVGVPEPTAIINSIIEDISINGFEAYRCTSVTYFIKPVPIPSAILLLGSGLIGLAWLKKQRNHLLN